MFWPAMLKRTVGLTQGEEGDAKANSNASTPSMGNATS